MQLYRSRARRIIILRTLPAGRLADRLFLLVHEGVEFGYELFELRVVALFSMSSVSSLRRASWAVLALCLGRL